MKERPNEFAATVNFEFDSLDEANNYRRALLKEFSPFLKGRVLDTGAGIGQFTELLGGLPAIEHLEAVEPDARFCDLFSRRLPGHTLIRGTIKDVEIGLGWDAIVSINVLEHILEDEAELGNYHQLLRARKGFLNLFVPAREELYAQLDRNFGHHRRYSKAGLRRKLEQAGFKIVGLRYFNFVGYFAWWMAFRFLKKTKYTTGLVRLFDRLVFPWVYQLESHVMAPPFGQSLLAVAQAE